MILRRASAARVPLLGEVRTFRIVAVLRRKIRALPLFQATFDLGGPLLVVDAVDPCGFLGGQEAVLRRDLLPPVGVLDDRPHRGAAGPHRRPRIGVVETGVAGRSRQRAALEVQGAAREGEVDAELVGDPDDVEHEAMSFAQFGLPVGRFPEDVDEHLECAVAEAVEPDLVVVLPGVRVLADQFADRLA